MPAPPLTNSFEGGTNGVNVSVANSGGASGDAFTDVGGGTTMQFTNAQAHGGNLSMRGVDVGANVTYAGWGGFGSLTVPVFFRWYMYLTAQPTTNNHAIIEFDTGAGATCAFMRIIGDGAGHLSASNAVNADIGATGSVAIALNQWVRMECRIVASTTVGQLEWRLFNTADSTTITETSGNKTNLALGANLGFGLWGNLISPAPTSPYTYYFDDLAVSTVDWIGPSITNVASVFYLRA